MERIWLITGAASGVGAELCRRVAAPGVAILAMVLAGFMISRGSEKLLFPKLGDK